MRRPSALLVLAIVALTGCSGDSPDTGVAPGGEITVLAAASLTDVFTDLAEEFERSHDGSKVTLAFGSSTNLAQQVVDGAPGDVLATADEASMRVAQDADTTSDVIPFATNVITLVTPAGNPGGVGSLADLDDVIWVRCADEVPCGHLARMVLERNHITSAPASLEEDVRATLDKVVSGEADAGLVYVTDAVAAGGAVETVPVAGAASASTTYFTAVLAGAGNAALARQWVAFVTSRSGLAILGRAGFGAPR